MLEFLNDPLFWYQASPYFLMSLIGVIVMFFMVEFLLTPKVCRRLRTAKWRHKSVFLVSHDDGFMDLKIGEPKTEGIIRLDKERGKLNPPVFIPMPKSNVKMIAEPDGIRPLSPQDQLVSTRYIFRGLGTPLWILHSSKPCAVNIATLNLLESNDPKQTFTLPQIMMPGNPGKKQKPFSFEVWHPVDPKTLKATLFQYFSSQHILADEKLTENIIRAENEQDWKRFAFPIAAISGVCIVAMVLVFFVTNRGSTASLWHGLSTLKGLFW